MNIEKCQMLGSDFAAKSSVFVTDEMSDVMANITLTAIVCEILVELFMYVVCTFRAMQP